MLDQQSILKFLSENKVKIPTAWKNNYADATFEVICKDDYLDFVLGKDGLNR
jgi:hypothetical protein